MLYGNGPTCTSSRATNSPHSTQSHNTVLINLHNTILTIASISVQGAPGFPQFAARWVPEPFYTDLSQGLFLFIWLMAANQQWPGPRCVSSSRWFMLSLFIGWSVVVVGYQCLLLGLVVLVVVVVIKLSLSFISSFIPGRHLS